MTARRIAFINEKGGTGKTTLAVNVAAFFALKRGARVLLIDMDTQGHAGKVLGLDVRHITPNVFHWLTEDRPFKDVALETSIRSLHVVPSYKEMADLPLRLAMDHRRSQRLADRLQRVSDEYDWIFFDAPPSLGLATDNILAAALEVVIPVGTTYLSLDGCAEMVATIERHARLKKKETPVVSLVVPTLYRKTALADEVLAKLEQHFPGRVSRKPISHNVSIDEAQSHARTIWEYAPWSRGAVLLQSLAEDIERVAPPRPSAGR